MASTQSAFLRFSMLFLAMLTVSHGFAGCAKVSQITDPDPRSTTTPGPAASSTNDSNITGLGSDANAPTSNANTPLGDSNTATGNTNSIIDDTHFVTGVVATFVGRTIALDPNVPSHVRFAWPGVAVGANFVGTSISATMRDYTNAYAGGPTGNSYYDVTVDGNATSTFGITFNTNTYVLADNLSQGPHTVWLRKRTEAMIGSTEFAGLTLSNGGNFLAPPVRLNRRVEVIGASIESGYGADGENCSGYQANLQNQDAAWPKLTANALGAELYNISYSGKGLVNNIDPLYDPTNTIPIMYELTDPMDFAVSWNFTGWQADVVIFDVGGNDWEGLGSAPDPNQFDTAFVSFVQHVLAYYPQAQIYITMNSTDPPDQRAGLEVDFQAIVSQLNHAGLTQVHYFEWAEYTGSNYGCDGHPDHALHQSMANALIPQIRADLGW